MHTLIAEAEKYVIHILNEKLNQTYVYHNLAHTQLVVEKTKALAERSLLDEHQTLLLILSAWFHDTGFTVQAQNHEAESVQIAEAFLEQQQVSNNDIKAITNLILATKLNYKPTTLSEKIIRDADCSHIGSKDFEGISERLRKEWELTCNKTFNETEWLTENINFLTSNHRFYSDAASSLWDKTKGKNLSRLLKSLKKIKINEIKLEHKKEEIALKKSRTERPERGIETMFRVTLRNHISLSDIADTKANILLSVNAIIISLVLSNLFPKLDKPSNFYLIYPTVVFVIFTVISMVLSVLATRPNVTSGKFTMQDVTDKKVNLLFFGNFHKMKLEEFEWAMNELMKDKAYLYNSMSKDLYFLGKVLDRKYKILRITYTFFIIGIILSVIAFSIAFQYS